MEKRNFTNSVWNGGKTAKMWNNSAKSEMVGMSAISCMQHVPLNLWCPMLRTTSFFTLAPPMASHVHMCKIVLYQYNYEQEIWANAHETRDSISLISAKIHSKCASQPKIAKKSLKTHIFAVQGRSRSSMLVPLESPAAVLVMICSKSVSICNHSCATLVDSSRNCTFSRGTQIWCARTEDSLNLGGQTLHRWNLRLMPNISYAGCPGLSWMV